MPQLRIHNRKNPCTVIVNNDSAEETIFLDKGKYRDISSSSMTEDVYTKWQYGFIKVEMLKRNLGHPVN